MDRGIRILLSNDDGFRAPGIRQLAQCLRSFGEVVVVAPSGIRSGYASAISTSSPLTLKHRLQEDGLSIYSVEGTPADCTKLALSTIFAKKPPTLVVSGINHGSNDGISVHYSGTIGAAREGAIVGIPSLAISLDDTAETPDFEDALRWSRKVVQMMLEAREKFVGKVMSLNIPKEPAKGLKLCRQGVSRFVGEYMQGTNAKGNPVYWLQGKQLTPEDGLGDTDIEFLREGYATLTPLTLDQTDYSLLESMRGMT